MRFLRLMFAYLMIVTSVAGIAQPTPSDRAMLVTAEAVDNALTLPPGYKRDMVLRAVSRNLRWFGQPDAGIKAARAMTDGGVTEVPLDRPSSMPRYVPLREAMSMQDPCDAGLWHTEHGEAKTPKDKEAWAEACLLTRDFHYIDLPAVEKVREVAANLPPGEIQGAVLAMLIQTYRDAESLRFTSGMLNESSHRMPGDIRDALARMLAQPAVAYRLGRKDQAILAAQQAKSFEPRAELIRLLVADSDAPSAVKIFDMLGATPPRYAEDCSGFFNSISGLDLSGLGHIGAPAPGIGAFIDLMPTSDFFRKICPEGLDGELFVEHMLAAGRAEVAIARARQEKAMPFLLIDALLQAARARYRNGDMEGARELAKDAATALPPFILPDPSPKLAAKAMVVGSPLPDEQATRNLGELSGNTHRRFAVIQLLAASGAVEEADELARRQPAGALRAVALSAAVAGRAGLRFDFQAPSLEVIDAGDL